MTYKELNLMLVKAFPEIKDVYLEETSWQDGDETGSHVVYEDVFVPYIRECVAKNDENMLAKVFEYIEKLLLLDDEYASEVVAFSVLEPLIFDEETEFASFIHFAGENTLREIKEILEGFKE